MASSTLTTRERFRENGKTITGHTPNLPLHHDNDDHIGLKKINPYSTAYLSQASGPVPAEFSGDFINEAIKRAAASSSYVAAGQESDEDDNSSKNSVSSLRSFLQFFERVEEDRRTQERQRQVESERTYVARRKEAPEAQEKNKNVSSSTAIAKPQAKQGLVSKFASAAADRIEGAVDAVVENTREVAGAVRDAVVTDIKEKKHAAAEVTESVLGREARLAGRAVLKGDFNGAAKHISQTEPVKAVAHATDTAVTAVKDTAASIGNAAASKAAAAGKWAKGLDLNPFN